MGSIWEPLGALGTPLGAVGGSLGALGDLWGVHLGPIGLQWGSFRTLVALFGGLQGTCGAFLIGFFVFFCIFLNAWKLFEQALRD